MAKIMNTNIEFMRPNLSMTEVIDRKIEQHILEGSEDAFYVCDLGDVAQKFKTWNVVFPRIKPFYAMKCNDDMALLELLALLGTGFDCASKGEIQKVLSIGVSPSKIIYANPCKQSSYIKFADAVGVNLMTFDNENELRKVKACFPDARMVLRILPPPTEKVQCVLGNKFGCQPKDAWKLLKAAQELGVKVVGVSFHVGSGCYDARAFRRAVEEARAIFDIAKEYGMEMSLLDVGGGFPGTEHAKITIHEIAAELNPALDELFPEGCGVDIISEPGRFFTASAYTLTTHVIAKRVVVKDVPIESIDATSQEETSIMYYVNDGVYGSFNCLLYDHADIIPNLPSMCQRGQKSFKSSIYGPTCDGLDLIIRDVEMPELHDGDWVFFRDMGSYTMAAGSCFNGIPRPRIYYIAEVNFGLSSNHDEQGQEISAEDMFDLHLRSGRDISNALRPLPPNSQSKLLTCAVADF